MILKTHFNLKSCTMRINAFILNRKEFDWFALFLFLQQIYRKSGHKGEEEEEEKESWATGSFE